MTQLYVQYDLVTGDFVGTVQCSPEQARDQTRQGVGLIAVAQNPLSQSMVNGVPTFAFDLEVIRASAYAMVDAAAGIARQRFITDVPGQAQTYERKEAEARRWQPGDPDGDYPFMAAEASMTGETIVEVRDSIMAAVNQLVPLAAHIEGKRMAAKKAIAAEANIKGIVDVAQVDFLAGLPL